MCESSCSTAFGGLSLFQESELLTAFITDSSPLRVFFPVVCSKYPMDITCIERYGTKICWMFPCYCRLLIAEDPLWYSTEVGDNYLDRHIEFRKLNLAGASWLQIEIQPKDGLQFHGALRFGSNSYSTHESVEAQWVSRSKYWAWILRLCLPDWPEEKFVILGWQAFLGVKLWGLFSRGKVQKTASLGRWLQQTEHKTRCPVQQALQGSCKQWTLNESSYSQAVLMIERRWTLHRGRCWHHRRPVTVHTSRVVEPILLGSRLARSLAPLLCLIQ